VDNGAASQSAARPINLALTNGLIVLRTAAGPTVSGTLDGDLVVFQADDLHAATRSGWPVG
jgi:hypothetical protein